MSLRRLWISLIAAALAAPVVTAVAEPSGPTVRGIHVRLTGSVYPGATTWEKFVQGRQVQCEGEVAQKLGMVHAFSVSGNLTDTGRIETDDYFAPERKMRSRRVSTYTVVETQLCRLEVVQTVSERIRQYAGSGYTDFERKSGLKKSAAWRKTFHPLLGDAKLAEMLLDGFMPDTQVSGPLGSQTVAGHRCDVYRVQQSKDIQHRICSLATSGSYPGKLTLAAKTVVGGMVNMEQQASLVELAANLPTSLFMPPDGEPITDIETAAGASTNATQKWCQAQLAKTGKNPCAKEE